MTCLDVLDLSWEIANAVLKHHVFIRFRVETVGERDRWIGSNICRRKSWYSKHFASLWQLEYFEVYFYIIRIRNVLWNLFFEISVVNYFVIFLPHQTFKPPGIIIFVVMALFHDRCVCFDNCFYTFMGLMKPA